MVSPDRAREVAVQVAEANLRSAHLEMRHLERDLSEQVRELAAREADLRRLRARIRKGIQEERRVNGRREIFHAVVGVHGERGDV